MVRPSPASASARLAVEGPKDGELVVRLAGRLDAASTGAIWREALALVERPSAKRLVVDASALDYCDGTGAALLRELARRQAARGAFELRGLRADLERVHALYARLRGPAGPTPGAKGEGLVHQVGRVSVRLLGDARALVAFVGELSLALAHAARHPTKVRGRDALLAAETAGADALPIVCIVCFLMGLIMAFQAAIPMQQFGADVFVADLVALSLLRELGPLMTAIVLAGRTGSALAAELGTMKVGEEIDALETMGLDPVRFLVTPRVLAAVAVTPLLTLFANLAGLLGGLVVFLSLGFPLVLYVSQVANAVDVVDLLGGLAKAFAFGVLVAAIGCQRGLSTGSGAAAVGQSTTSAVVSGIVLIALADAAFSVAYYVLGI